MRFIINQNWWSWGDDFYIKDGNGNDVYYVDGKAFSVGDNLTVKDLSGAKMASIHQRLISFGATYDIYRGSELLATISKHLFTLMRHKFAVDVPGTNDLEAAGDFFNREYTFERGGAVVGRASKQLFAINDTYGVEINDGEDPILLLCAAIVIDLVLHDDKKQAK